MTGACGGMDLLSTYTTDRIDLQISLVVLNALTLVASSALCWRLRDHFGWQTFKRIGANDRINRLYKLLMVLGIVLQLDVFVLLVFFALWLDQVSNSLWILARLTVCR